MRIERKWQGPSGEEIQKTDWVRVEVPPDRVGAMVEGMMLSKHESPQFPVISGYNQTYLAWFAIESAFRKLFKSGLKSSSQPLSECFFRFFSSPVDYQDDPKVLEAVSYEIRAYFKPRYSVDGNEGYYSLVFTTCIKEIKKDSPMKESPVMMFARRKFGGHVDSCGVVMTKCSSRSKNRVARDVREMGRESVEEAVTVIRRNIMNPLRGGAFELGKRRK